jgi:hypothetical protein
VVSSTQIVNRTQKGDRLPLVLALPPTRTEQIGLSAQALPEGCEAAGSPLAHFPLEHPAGRCLS